MPIHTRRQFTCSAVAGLLFSPFIAQLEGRRARAASGKKLKRLLLFCTMGTNPPMWTPTGLSGETINNWSAMTAPLAKIKENVVLIEGLPSGNPGNGHGAPDGLAGTGYGDAYSVDQFIGDQLKAMGINSPIPVLLLGASSSAGGGRTMFSRKQNLPTIASPMQAYSTVFTGGGATVTTAGGAPAVAPDKLLKRRKSIIDIVNADLAALGQRVGSQEKAKLQLHVDSIRQLENRLTMAATPPMPGKPTGGGGGGGCMKPAAPMDSSNAVQIGVQHMDVIVGAFSCDITRVAAVEFGSDQSLPVDIPDLGLKADQHGGMLHSGAPDFKNLIALEGWFASRFADLVTKLKATPEADGSGSLLDNTLVAWCRDMGDAVTHNQKSMRFVLASGAGGYLKTAPGGRYLNGPGDSAANRHERVLLTFCDALGITKFTGFGDPKLTGADKTPLSSLIA